MGTTLPEWCWTSVSARVSDGLEVDERATPVVGYRMWRWREYGPGYGRLVSLFRNHIWEKGDNTFECPGPIGHEVPTVGCVCGFWARSSIVSLLAYRAKLRDQQSIVVGAVLGWGEVLEHGLEGWRGQYARPIALMPLFPFEERRYLGLVSRIYEIPIQPTTWELTEYAESQAGIKEEAE